MKIAIMTQPLGKNYGGIIQAYALQEILRRAGHDVVTINRLYNKSFIRDKVKSTLRQILKRKIVKKLSDRESKYIYSGMSDFINNYINLTNPIRSNFKLKLHYKKSSYDLFIVGSDQVWRPKYSPNIYNYFFDFLDKNEKRISYAASFGVDDWEFSKIESVRCKKLVKKFKAVSVRELSAVKLCKKKLKIDAQVVLDPALLLTKQDYINLLPENRITNSGKVLKYILDENADKTEVLEIVAHKLKLDIFSAQPKLKLNEYSDNIEDYKFPSMETWIMSFADAELIVTDSFHGCLFSILFNKPFIVVGNIERGLSRFNSLLSTFGLENRMVLSAKEDIESLLNDEINWIEVNERLNILRTQSLSFLERYT